MNLITIFQKIVGRFPGPGLLFEKLGTKVIAVNGTNGVWLKFVFPILKSFIIAIVRQHIDPHQHVTRFLSANPFIHFVIIDKMTVSYRIFAKFFEVAEVANFSKEEYAKYIRSENNYYDWDSIFRTAEKKGREEGLAEGKAEASRENAKKMKADGVPVELIAKYTGLSPEEIKGL